MTRLIAILLFATCASGFAQTGPRAMSTLSNGVVKTDRTNAILFTNIFRINALTNVTGPNVVLSTTNGQLTNGSVPSGAASSNSILRADGAGGSAFVAENVFLARQTTNGPVVTNGAATTSLTISNIPAGLYWVQGQLNSTTTTSRLFQLTATHQVLGPRNVFGWFDSGGSAGFFNSATNMHNNTDGASGTRNGAISGPLLFTNTATVSFFVSVTGATNTAQILSNSFLFLRKLD